MEQATTTRVLFWNVGKKDLTDLVCTIARSLSVDIVVLIESGARIRDAHAALRESVSEDFYIPWSISTAKFHCFCRRLELDLTEVHFGDRNSVRRLCVQGKTALLGLVHGPDIRNYDTETRQSFAQSVATDLRMVKREQENERLIVIGDFNMNPFDRGMNLAAGFNAMMTRDCVRPVVEEVDHPGSASS